MLVLLSLAQTGSYQTPSQAQGVHQVGLSQRQVPAIRHGESDRLPAMLGCLGSVLSRGSRGRGLVDSQIQSR